MPALRAVVLAAVSLVSPARADWEEVAKEHDVVVSQREVPGRVLPTFRGIGEIDANLYQVLAVLEDVPRHTKWMHDCIDSRMLRRVSDTEMEVYNRTDAPWPVSDRDVVLDVKVVIVERGKEVDSLFHAVSTPLMPELSGVVRMPRVEGRYKLIAVSETKTRVEYQVDADPGGSLPTRVARSVSRDLPLHTIVNLRAQVGATHDEYKDFVADWSQRN